MSSLLREFRVRLKRKSVASEVEKRRRPYNEVGVELRGLSLFTVSKYHNINSRGDVRTRGAESSRAWERQSERRATRVLEGATHRPIARVLSLSSPSQLLAKKKHSNAQLRGANLWDMIIRGDAHQTARRCLLAFDWSARASYLRSLCCCCFW